MSNSIFSAYSQGENRVTSTIVQVLKNLPINLVERFLGMLTQDDTTSFFVFQNQVKSGTHGTVPDAEISASFAVLIETKIKPGQVDATQLAGHLAVSKARNANLIYLTPDATKPDLLEGTGVVWRSFHDVSALMDELRTGGDLVLSERDAFLLQNLQTFFNEEGLLPDEDACVVVAAAAAWPVYQRHGVYVCQSGRTFRRVTWLGFYANGAIQTSLAKINGAPREVFFPETGYGEITCEKLRGWLDAGEDPQARGQSRLVFDLSKVDEADTRTIREIPNTLRHATTGRRYAFTQGQRYTTLQALEAAKSTQDL